MRSLDIARMDFVEFAKAFHGGAVPVPDASVGPSALPDIPYRRGSYRHAEVVPEAPGYLVVDDAGIPGVMAYARTVEAIGRVAAWADPDVGLVRPRGVPEAVADEVALRHMERVAATGRDVVRIGYDELFAIVDVHRRAVTKALQVGHPLPTSVVEVYRANGETAALANAVLRMDDPSLRPVAGCAI